MNSAKKWQSILDAVFMSTLFCEAMVTEVRKADFGIPALSSARLSILFTLFGEMGSLLGDANT